MKSKLPPILALLYLILFAVSAIPIFSGSGALSGIFATILSAPWSMLLSKVLPNAGNSVAGGLALVGVGAVVNACLIFLLSRWIVGKVAR